MKNQIDDQLIGEVERTVNLIIGQLIFMFSIEVK